MQFSLKHKSRRKVFFIGRNKTGTPTIGQALSDMGFWVGNQPKTEQLTGG